jgi:predicted metal-dependent hydrolase
MPDIPQFQTRRSRRQSIGIQIEPDGNIKVFAPYLIPQFIVNKFVADHKDWILKHLSKIKKTTPSVKTGYAENTPIPYLGQDYPLHFGKYTQINLTDKLNMPEILKFRLKKELTGWYIRQAKSVISQRTAYYCRIMDTSVNRLTFSDTSSKWGSCSRNNELQFSWRLIMAPLLVLDYVVVHELAHTRFKHHQHDFWQEVKKYKPAYKQYVKWLKENSRRIHSII